MKELIFQNEPMFICQINKKKCMLCHYWYFSNKNFSYGPYLCDGCYDISQKSADFKNIAIAHVKKVYTEFIFCI